MLREYNKIKIMSLFRLNEIIKTTLLVNITSWFQFYSYIIFNEIKDVKIFANLDEPEQ